MTLNNLLHFLPAAALAGIVLAPLAGATRTAPAENSVVHLNG
jgi:hypothetical protein